MELTLETSLGIEALSFISFPKHEFLLHFSHFLLLLLLLLLLTFLGLDSRERGGGRDDTTAELSVCVGES